MADRTLAYSFPGCNPVSSDKINCFNLKMEPADSTEKTVNCYQKTLLLVLDIHYCICSGYRLTTSFLQINIHSINANGHKQHTMPVSVPNSSMAPGQLRPTVKCRERSVLEQRQCCCVLWCALTAKEEGKLNT